MRTEMKGQAASMTSQFSRCGDLKRASLPNIKLMVALTATAAAMFLMAVDGDPAHAAGADRADLVTTRATTVSRTVAQGGQLTASWVLKNQGSRNARKSTTLLLLSRDRRADKRDILLSSAAEKTLKARRTIKRRRKGIVPANAKPGLYRLLICADASKQVKERNERNNCRSGRARSVRVRELAIAIRAPAPGAVFGGATSVTLSARSTARFAALEVWLGGTRVAASAASASPGQLSRSIGIDFSRAPNGTHLLSAIVKDAHGSRAVSQPVPIRLANPIGAEGPSTGLILKAPTRLAELESRITKSGAQVIEYFHERQATDAPPLPAELTGLLSGSGVSVAQPISTVSGGFYGRGMSPSEQFDSYRAGYHQDVPGQEPVVFGLRINGLVDPTKLGPLGALVAHSVPLEPHATFSAAGARRQPGIDTRGRAKRRSSPSGRSTDRAKPASPMTRAAATAEPTPWWPTFGQFDSRQYTQEKKVRNALCGIAICPIFGGPPRTVTIKQERVQFVHDLVWTGAALASFDGADRAYEHDFKILGDRAGTRPFCNPFSDGGFYASRSSGVLWNSTVPDAAAAYLDTDSLDSCSQADLTVGVAYPEKLDDGLAAGTSPAYRLWVDVVRNQQDGAFKVAAQSVDRETAACERFPRQLLHGCIGLDQFKTKTALILQTSGEKIPGIKLPACVVWKWLPTGPSTAGPNRITRCGFDRDNDGYDDSIDCGPGDASINPAAVDSPNDGIDQNCDGSDLTVGAGKIQATLIWDNEVDMDLHVTEPNNTEIWYQNRGPTTTGGQLDRDDNVCSRPNTEPGGVENIFWPNDSGALVGNYEVRVVEFGLCGQAAPANWILEIRVGGQLVKRETGSGGGQTFTFNA